MLTGFTRATAILVGLLCVPAVPSAPRPKDADRDDKLAVEATQQFDKALFAKDVDGVLAVVDTPFFWDEDEPKADRDRLRVLLTRLFREETYNGAKLVPEKTTNYADAAPKLRKQLREGLDRFADPNDRVVIERDVPSGGLTATLVRVRDGKAKVISFFHY